MTMECSSLCAALSDSQLTPDHGWVRRAIWQAWRDAHRPEATERPVMRARTSSPRCRTRWLSGAALRDQLGHRSADPGLRSDLDEIAGETLADL
ncbi:MAG: hypothetical protein DLM56_09685 [Pseudonocardiales bacterium]|nr:MAG: hypothetical protein DLM56_09685 [Pseudonocardiales bacterium]